MINLVSGFKKFTHVLGVAGGSALVWAYSDKGQAVLSAVYHAYPKATVVSSVIGFLAILYRSPKQNG